MKAVAGTRGCPLQGPFSNTERTATVVALTIAVGAAALFHHGSPVHLDPADAPGRH